MSYNSAYLSHIGSRFTKLLQVQISLISINLLKFQLPVYMYDNDNNLSNVMTEREGVQWMLLDEQPDGEFQTEMTKTRDSKFVEDSFSFGQQVFFSFSNNYCWIWNI